MKTQRQGGFLIAKIHQLTGRIFARKLKEHEIREFNPAQGRIMFVLWRNDGISINELAKKTQLGKSTLTTMLDRLEGAGFLTRMPSKKDRRKILIKRIDQDGAIERKYIEVSQEMNKLFYDGFSDNEIDRFEKYLSKILYNLTAFESRK